MKQIINNDNLKELQNKDSNSIDLILTDIPYGLDDVDALDLIQNNTNNTKGFMGKTWDRLPNINILKEFHRVLKDGGWFITTFIPRQDLQTILYYRLLKAGFDVSFSPIYHTFASGFPKGNNISKKLDKRAGAKRKIVGHTTQGVKSIFDRGKERPTTLPTTPEAKYCDGLYGEFQPKPAVEIVVVAQKKYKANSQIDHALNWYNERRELLEKGITEEELSLYTKLASGGTWFDEGRIPCASEKTPKGSGNVNKSNTWLVTVKGNGGNITPEQGRYPANLLVSDDCLDVGRESKSEGRAVKKNEQHTKSHTNIINSKFRRSSNIIDKGDLSRFFSKESWVKKHLPEFYKLSSKTLQLEEDADKIYPFLNVSKASVKEKNAGLDEFESKQITKSTPSNLKDNKNPNLPVQNTHVTAKNITLFAYLLKLFSKENDVVLDPYCGSGTTLIACELTNRHYIGIELKKEYYDIALARVEYWKKQKERWGHYEDSKIL